MVSDLNNRSYVLSALYFLKAFWAVAVAKNDFAYIRPRFKSMLRVVEVNEEDGEGSGLNPKPSVRTTWGNSSGLGRKGGSSIQVGDSLGESQVFGAGAGVERAKKVVRKNVSDASNGSSVVPV